MALKKPSDFFGESKKESIIENLVKKPELGSFSAAVNSYKENISKFEDLSETLKSIESIQSDIKDFIKKEDLDNAVGSYAFLLEETVAKLKNDVKGINEKNLISMRSNISNLTEKINTFFKIEVPKYKKNIVEIEIKSSDKFEKYKNDTDVILEDISKYVSDKYESIDGINKDTILEIEKSISKHQIDIEQRTEKNISSVNETVDRVVEDLEKKINLISDNKDTIFQDLSKKITEVKNLKKSVNKDLKVYEDHKNNVENKISDLEIEVIRSKSNLKNQNEEFIKVKKDIGNDFNTIHEEFKTVVNRLNLDELEEKNIQLSKKVKYLEEIFDKFNEKEFLNEGLVNITPETDNSDPLTPLDKNYVTLNQLQDHYRLFLNRIQQQLSTLGGGGETRLQYLDDIVGVATNLSDYNGKFLRVDTSQPAGKNFVFETVSGGGGGGSSDVVDDTTPQLGGNLDLNGKYITGTGGVNVTGDAKISGVTTMGNVVVGGATTDLVVTGDARVTGILTIGTASITLDGENGEVIIPTTMKVGSAITCSSSGDSFWAGIVTATNFKTGTTNVHSNGIEVAGINVLGADTPIGTGATIYDEGGAGFTGVVTSTKSHVGLDTGFFNEDLVVTGDARVTGILTIGTGSITLDPNAKTITGIDEIEIGTGDNRIKLKKSSRGTLDFVDKDNRSIGGIGSEAKINTTGVITATTFVGDLTGTATTATKLENRAASYYLNYDNFTSTPTIPNNNNQLSNGAGFITAAGTLTNGTQTNITSIGTLTSLEVNGDVSIGGTLTYEDVNNIDSVGLVTARRGIVVGSGYGIHVASGVITATTFDGNLATSNLTGTITNAQLAGSIADGKLASTFLKNVLEDTTPQLGGDLDGNSKNIYGLGIATVTQHFSGDITGVGATFTNITGTLVTGAQTNITSVGTIGAGTWQGTAIGDSYISSAATWNAKQSALTFGIANTNAIKIDDADAADNDYAKLTATGIEGRSYAEVKTDLSLDNVENTALSTWVGSTNITTLGTIATGTWQGTAIGDSYISSAATWNAKIANVLEDTTPQLGGNLDANSKSIYGVGILTATQIADGNSQVGAAGSVLSSTGSGLSWVAQSGGGGGGSQNVFSTIAVSGQNNVVADATTDTLTLVAGTNVTITTDDSADSVTINASGGGGGGASVGVSSNTNYIGTGVTNFNFVGTGITASLTAGASANTVANVYIPTATRTTNRYIATANQTTFSATYSVGYVDVFLNGIKLDGQDEFTATNGTSVVLTDGATVNDIVEIVAQQISANLTITGMTDVVNDTTPQLGGNLDVNGKDISGTGDVNLAGIVTATTFSGNISGVGATFTNITGTNITGGTFSGNVDLSGLLKEGVNITAGKLSDNFNIDLANGMVHLFTTEETTTSSPNLVFGGSSVNAKMSTGEAITVVIITTTDATGYSAELLIDGSATTEQWLGGNAPTEGGASGYDVYTHNIIKTADATFVVLSNLVNFA
jgi:hypothetical protein